MLINCPSCNARYDCEPGKYECECGTTFSVTADGSVSTNNSIHLSSNRNTPSNSFDIDQTIPPRQYGEGNRDLDMTMPGKRERKPDGRFDVGDLILGRYKVLSELGQGGMGVVYKCFDEIAGIEIALKALPPELSHNTMEMEDVRENFQLISRLVHQNIAISKNLEKDNATGNYYLIMECVEGEDLRHWIRRKRKDGPLTVDTILPVIKQVAAALDYAHEQRIIHRDIKPGNIMIDAAGHVKVLDFGLAAQIHTSMTRVSMAYHGTSGTAPYMAPEQWRGRAQGAAADQYALAVMTYEMLAGHLPFESTDASVLREAILNETPEPLRGIPAYAQQALERGMSKEPEKRFESCLDFVTALGGGKISNLKPEQVSPKQPNSTPPSPLADNTVDRETTIKRIYVLMEQREWEKAHSYCEKLLDIDPENPELYLMMCMIEHKISNELMLSKSNCNLKDDKNYSIAIKFASPERKQQLLDIQNVTLVNFYLSKCMSERKCSDIDGLAHSVKPLISDKTYQLALNYASEEKKNKLLQIQYEQADYMLEQLKSKYKVKDIIQVPVPLETDTMFQAALQSVPPDRQNDLLLIQQNQGDYFLRKCMEENHVTALSELICCEKPLGEDYYFKTAILCSSSDQKEELQRLQEKQAEVFLKRCMDANHISCESDLPCCSTPLHQDQNFCLAIKYASAGRKKELEQLQFKQSDHYLQKCMEYNGVSDVSRLYRTKNNLTNDSYFRMAKECASSEQQKSLDAILAKHVVCKAKTFTVHVITLLLLSILGIILLLGGCVLIFK